MHKGPPKLQILLADLRSTQGRHEEAEQIYRALLEKDKKNVAVMNNLAFSLAVRRVKLKEALALMEQAIELAGPIGNLLDTRAVVLLAMDNPAEALADLNDALAQAPSAARYFHRAQVDAQLGDKPAAKESLAEARKLGLKPEHLDPLERSLYEKLPSALE